MALVYFTWTWKGSVKISWRKLNISSVKHSFCLSWNVSFSLIHEGGGMLFCQIQKLWLMEIFGKRKKKTKVNRQKISRNLHYIRDWICSIEEQRTTRDAHRILNLGSYKNSQRSVLALWWIIWTFVIVANFASTYQVPHSWSCKIFKV